MSSSISIDWSKVDHPKQFFSTFPSRRSVVYSTKGIVASSQPLATQAGLHILLKGGNAGIILLLLISPHSFYSFNQPMPPSPFLQHSMLLNQVVVVSAGPFSPLPILAFFISCSQRCILSFLRCRFQDCQGSQWFRSFSSKANLGICPSPWIDRSYSPRRSQFGHRPRSASLICLHLIHTYSKHRQVPLLLGLILSKSLAAVRSLWQRFLILLLEWLKRGASSITPPFIHPLTPVFCSVPVSELHSHNVCYHPCTSFRAISILVPLHSGKVPRYPFYLMNHPETHHSPRT